MMMLQLFDFWRFLIGFPIPIAYFVKSIQQRCADVVKLYGMRMGIGLSRLPSYCRLNKNQNIILRVEWVR